MRQGYRDRERGRLLGDRETETKRDREAQRQRERDES